MKKEKFIAPKTVLPAVKLGGAVWIVDWILVDKKLPPKFTNYKLSSIDVIVKNRLGEISKAHFNFALNGWMMRSKKFCAPVTHWSFMKEYPTKKCKCGAVNYNDGRECSYCKNNKSK